MDDDVDVFLNGEYHGKSSYVWGARIAEPVNIPFSSSTIKYGEENELMIRISDLAMARGGGLLGNVFVYNTEPYIRTDIFI